MSSVFWDMSVRFPPCHWLYFVSRLVLIFMTYESLIILHYYWPIYRHEIHEVKSWDDGFDGCQWHLQISTRNFFKWHFLPSESICYYVLDTLIVTRHSDTTALAGDDPSSPQALALIRVTLVLQQQIYSRPETRLLRQVIWMTIMSFWGESLSL